MTTSTIEIEIDGKKLDVEPGSMVIEAADNAGIPIPRFCYHKKLSIAANCRMCLVEVEKVGKPLPACATPVTAGMKVFTNSEKARLAQRGVMEFLLINHPLDCPICDQGGECELQDVSLEYGKDISRYTEGKRSVADEDIGPLVATEMTRCIQCTRCVRFGEEIAGVRELGAIGRGEHLWIGTYIKHSLSSEIAANIIDLCPVGALTSKPFRFTARAWELTQQRSVAPHDCLGSNVFIHSRRQEVMRVVPRENEKINETWLSDRDRFSYLGINHPDRLLKPRMKMDGVWQDVEWEIALRAVVAKISTVLNSHGPEQLATFAFPSSTLEEFYLLQKLTRALGSNNIDHRLHQSDFSDQEHVDLAPGFVDINVADIEDQDNIVIIGSNLQHEQPLAAVRVRKAVSQGAQLYSINPIDFELTCPVNENVVIHPAQLVNYVAGIIIEVAELTGKNLPKYATFFRSSAHKTSASKAMAERLINSENNIILLGELAQNFPNAATLRKLCHSLSELIAIKVVDLTFGANSAGAWIAGAVPHRKEKGLKLHKSGLNTLEALQQKLKAYLLFGIEPDKDFAHSALALSALSEADAVIAFTAFTTPALLEHADILLPIATFTETSGTFINVEGDWQTFVGAVPPKGEARPGWKVLRVLANFFDLEGFEHSSSELVHDELKSAAEYRLTERVEHEASEYKHNEALTRITVWPIYQIDSLTRRAEALQQTPINEMAQAHINKSLARKLGLQEEDMVFVKQDHHKVKLPINIDNRIPDDCVYVPAGFAETATLGAPFGAISLEKVSV